MEPSLELHIERLVLHGVAPRDRDLVGAALQAELGRLLTERGIPAGLSRGGALDRLRIDPRSLAAGASAEVMGVQIAQAIYRGLSSQDAVAGMGAGAGLSARSAADGRMTTRDP